MDKTKNFPGLDNFVWWTGIVEGRKDPLKLGRLQVRIFGWHQDDKKMVPSENLLWAQPVLAANNYDKTNIPKEGEVVMGFFMDGEYGQFPFYFGIIPNIPEIIYPQTKGFSDPAQDVKERPIPIHVGGPTRYPAESDLNQPTTSRLARAENIEQTPLPMAILPPVYSAKYPYNSSTVSESGHYFNMDDTQMAENILLMHRLASYIQLGPAGEITIASPTMITIFAPIVAISGY